MIFPPRRIRAALAGLAAFALPPPAAADAVVTLRQALEVTGDTIALSDIFEGVPAELDIDIARAPAPGAQVSIDPVWLQARAHQHGLDWPNAFNARRVAVRRASQTVSTGVVSDLIAEELAARFHADYAVTMSGARTLHAPIDAPLAPSVQALSFDQASNSFTVDVALYPGGPAERLAGRAEAAIETPVLVRPLSRGEVIEAADIEFARLPASRAPADAITDPRSLVGLAARRGLRPGVPLKPTDLDRPAVIARGETVLVRFERGALMLTARARALSDVAEGEQARFVNLQSNRVVDAVAVGPGEAWLVAAAPVGLHNTRQRAAYGGPAR